MDGQAGHQSKNYFVYASLLLAFDVKMKIECEKQGEKNKKKKRNNSNKFHNKRSRFPTHFQGAIH